MEDKNKLIKDHKVDWSWWVIKMIIVEWSEIVSNYWSLAIGKNTQKISVVATHSPCSGKSITTLYKRKNSNKNNNIINNNNSIVSSWWAHHNNNKTSPNQLTPTTIIIVGTTIKRVTISNKVTLKDTLVRKILFFSTQGIKTITVISSINNHKRIWWVKKLTIMKLLSLRNILCLLQIQIKRTITLAFLLIKSVLSSLRLHKPPNSKPAWAPQQIFPV